MKISAFRNRLQVDTSAREGIVELLLGGLPFWWNGTCLQFEVALFRKETLVDDLSNLSQITLEIKDLANIQGAALMSATIVGSGIDGDLKLEDWEGGDEDDCHAKFQFTGSESNLSLGGSSKNFWMVIAAKRADGEAITLGCSKVTVVEDGSTLTPTSTGAGNVLFNAGYLELRFPDGSWHRLKPSTIEGAFILDIDQTASGATADLVSAFWRYSAGLPQIQFGDASWHAFVPNLIEGQYSLDLNQANAGAADGDATKFRVNLGFAELKFGDATWHRINPVLNGEGQYTIDIEQTATP